MNSYLLIFALLLYCVSFVQMLRQRKKSGVIRFLYLFWTHILIGAGYLFLAFYQHWNWGIRYKRFAHIDFTNMTYYYVLLLCFFLLILTRMRFSSVSRGKERIFLKLKPFSSFDIILLIWFIFIYLLGVHLRTLSTMPISLPFRLNGVIELSLILLFPIYISLRTINHSRGLWIGFGIVMLYSILNIISFGSKGPAVYPLVVFTTTTIAMKPLNLTRIAIPMLVVVSLYAVFNPYYFRQSLVNGERVSNIEKLKKSSEFVDISSNRVLLGIRNLAVRITGILPMQQAIDDSSNYFTSIQPWCISFKPNRYYNEKIQFSPYGTSDATGHFGCFMFMFHNHVIGALIGFFLLFFFYRISCYFDYLAYKNGKDYFLVQGVFFVMWALGLMVDGNYDKLSGYLKLIFGLIVIGIISRILLMERPVRKRKLKKLG